MPLLLTSIFSRKRTSEDKSMRGVLLELCNLGICEIKELETNDGNVIKVTFTEDTHASLVKAVQRRSSSKAYAMNEDDRLLQNLEWILDVNLGKHSLNLTSDACDTAMKEVRVRNPEQKRSSFAKHALKELRKDFSSTRELKRTESGSTHASDSSVSSAGTSSGMRFI